ncbi:MAG: hypothetical protein JRI54_00030 [Deltaproteobacteria bacterium]|nr:hypothetical protein [Deltaproteobacteria bacterium]
MKVFQMDDCAWVAAHSLEEAAEWYKKECGIDDEDIDPKEVSLDGTMFDYYDGEDAEELKSIFHKHPQIRSITTKDGVFIYRDMLQKKTTFREVIKKSNIEGPFIIACTEW